MKIKKGDKVKVISGKSKGKVAPVIKTLPPEDKVVVEGVNVVKKHQKPTYNREGGIIELTKPVPVSTVMLVCSKCEKPTRVGYRLEGDKKVRVCKKCDRVL